MTVVTNVYPFEPYCSHVIPIGSHTVPFFSPTPTSLPGSGLVFRPLEDTVLFHI